jgi:hypothetical protein
MRTLRHTGNLRLVQKLLRHTDIKTTANCYTDALIEDIRGGLEATAKSIESQKKSQTEIEMAEKTMKDSANFVFLLRGLQVRILLGSPMISRGCAFCSH